MQGERSNEEKVHLEKRIDNLTEELDDKNNTHTLLTLQLKRLQVWWNVYKHYIHMIKIRICIGYDCIVGSASFQFEISDHDQISPGRFIHHV